MEMLDGAAVSYRIVLTKTDKIKASELEKVQADVAAKLRKHVAAFPELSVTSAEKKGGIEDLRAAVLEAVET
jgi:GTP-binding protein